MAASPWHSRNGLKTGVRPLTGHSARPDKERRPARVRLWAGLTSLLLVEAVVNFVYRLCKAGVARPPLIIPEL